jgi:hypothetical protein
MSSDEQKTKGLYTIDNFTVGQYQPSRSGFTVTLHKDVAAALLTTARPAECDLMKMMNEEIVRAFGDRQAKYVKPEFFKNTWLLTSLTVPGDAAYISLGGYQLSELEGYIPGEDLRHFKYEPHNVDSLLQSSCLLSQWLIWFNAVIALTDFEQPSRLG